ncbi:tyrosine-type recombinase/integrase [Fictibacillus sp. WQ 8-8]|uniref:tyrosine-type recombinase/integrase n=1 Tax=unclassified Fictibacillus TaxID=2644029 RepID=UPI0035C6DC4B|nr:tyrosine-type recombinase/integrase [Fictibacillus sp. WQ 8-8]
MVETLYSTGVRVSELINITLEEIKWETRQIWIRKGKGNKERFVLFTHECYERIKAYLSDRETDSKYLFTNRQGGRLSRVFIEYQFRQFSDALGFRITPHTMRHTFAAHLAEKNMPQSYIQELLGHANINSTRIYTRLMESARKKQYDKYQ